MPERSFVSTTACGSSKWRRRTEGAPRMRVIIAGAGLGGLTLALSLRAAGIEAEVFEAAPELKPVGVGINVLPHAARELTELGLGERLAERAIATQALMYANQFGQEI